MASTGAAGRVVPPRTLWEEALVFLWERVGGLWRWRELTLPPAAVYVAYATAGGYAASWVAAVLCLVVGSVGLVRPSVLSRIPRRCTARSRWHGRLRRWPRFCLGLHWYRKLEEGALLVPALLSWEERAGQVAVEVRPLPEQQASSWDAMADAFRRFLGGASVEWRESFGTLRIVVSRVGLPDFLPWHAHGSPEGRLVLGRRHGGGPLAIDARTTPHVLLAGATGSGKGGAIRAAAAAALQGGWHLVILDPKKPASTRGSRTSACPS